MVELRLKLENAESVMESVRVRELRFPSGRTAQPNNAHDKGEDDDDELEEEEEDDDDEEEDDEMNEWAVSTIPHCSRPSKEYYVFRDILLASVDLSLHPHPVLAAIGLDIAPLLVDILPWETGRVVRRLMTRLEDLAFSEKKKKKEEEEEEKNGKRRGRRSTGGTTGDKSASEGEAIAFGINGALTLLGSSRLARKLCASPRSLARFLRVLVSQVEPLVRAVPVHHRVRDEIDDEHDIEGERI